MGADQPQQGQGIYARGLGVAAEPQAKPVGATTRSRAMEIRENLSKQKRKERRRDVTSFPSGEGLPAVRPLACALTVGAK